MNQSMVQNTQLNIPIWRQLRWNLIVFTVLVAVVPVLAIGQFVLVQTRDQSTRQVINQLESVATLKQGALADWLESTEVVVDAYLSSRATYAQLVAFAQTDGSLTGQAVNINNTLTNALNTIASDSPTFTELFIYNLDGQIIASTNEVQIGKVVRLQPYFTPSLQTSYVQYPYYEVGTGELAMFTTRPLVSEAGTIVSIIAARLNLDTLGNIMSERSGLGNTGETYLVSVENSYLLTPSRFAGYDTNHAYHSLGIDQALGGQSDSGIYDNYQSPAARVIGVYRWQPELQSALLSEISEDEALASFQEIARAIGTVTLIAAVVAGLLSLLVVDRVVQPINALTRIATRIAQGDYAQRATVQSRNEVGVLAETFNTMTDQLQNVLNTLEERISARTRDLQTAANVNSQIASILDVDTLLLSVVDLTKDQFGLYHAHIYLLDEPGINLVLTSGAGEVGQTMVAQKRQIALDNPQSIVAQAARNRRGVIINDVTLSPTFLSNPLLPDTHSEMAVPLIARGQVLGVLDVQSNLVNYFNNDVFNVIELLAGQIATAINNARLYEAAERTSRYERALGTIDRRIQDAVDLDEILRTSVRELGKALSVPYTAIELQVASDDLPDAVAATESELEA